MLCFADDEFVFLEGENKLNKYASRQWKASTNVSALVLDVFSLQCSFYTFPLLGCRASTFVRLLEEKN